MIIYNDTIAAYDRTREQTIWVNNKCSTCGKGIENLIDSKEWYENKPAPANENCKRVQWDGKAYMVLL